MTKKVKILITYYKPSELFKDEVLTPIHLGRALATQENKDGEVSKEDFKWLCENMIGDDTGDNISHLNREFNELTGIYWAWKNYDKLGNPNYIGFMSYRRLFYLNKKDVDRVLPMSKKQKSYAYLNFDNFSEFYWDKKDTKALLEKLEHFDCIFNSPVILQENIKESYKSKKALSKGHIPSDIDMLEDLALQNFPQYKEKIKEYLYGQKSYFTNMFVMKKEIFFEYCEFVFKLLFAYHQSVDYKNRNVSQKRMFVSERATGIFYEILKSKRIRIAEIPVAVVHNTGLTQKILPAFETNNLALVFSTDDVYLPYLYVAINSLIKNSNPNLNYDICILHTKLDKNMSKYFSNLVKSNVSIRFVDISVLIGRQRSYFYISGHVSSVTYYRLFIPELFSAYEKILYLDSDMIILCDISKLYDIDLENKTLAACKEIGIEYLLRCGDDDLKEYISTKLGLKNPHNYFQAGLIIYDIKKCINANFTKICLDKLEQIQKPKLHDQDILNSLFEDNVKFLPLEYNYTWNVEVKFNSYPQCFPSKLALEVKKAETNPLIIHYNDNFKPWNSPYLPKADIWFSYARETPFYESIVFNMAYTSYNNGAIEKIKSYLSYKLGYAMLKAKKNPLKALILPLTLIYVFVKHKLSQLLIKLLVDTNPKLEPLELKQYSDYRKALEIKKYLSFRLGQAFLKNPLTFIFKLNRIYKEWKKDR